MTQPRRLPTFPNVDRTAVVDFSMPGTFRVDAGTNRVLLTRQPVYPLWYTVQTVNDGAVGYALGYRPTSFSGPDARYSMPDETVMMGSGDAGVDPVWAVDELTNVGRPAFTAGPGVSINTSYSVPILGADPKIDNIPFFYVPVGSTFTVCVSFPDPAASNPFTFEYERWNQPGELVRGVYTFTSGNGADLVLYADIPATGWIRPVSLARTNTTGWTNATMPALWLAVNVGAPALVFTPSATSTRPNIVVNGTTTTSNTMPVPVPTDYWISPTPFTNTRVTASAVNIENVTKALDKEGTIMCGRVNPATQNPLTVTASQLASYHPLEKTQLSMQNGVYTFTVPSQESERYFDYNLPVSFYRGPGAVPTRVTGVPCLDLSSTNFWNAMVFSDPDGGSKMSFTLDWHIEFRTTSTLWPIAFATEPIESYHKAVQALYKTPFFTRGRDLAKQAKATYLDATTRPPARRNQPAKRRGQQGNRVPKPKNPSPSSAKIIIQAPPRNTQIPKGKPKMASGLDLYLASRKK